MGNVFENTLGANLFGKSEEPTMPKPVGYIDTVSGIEQIPIVQPNGTVIYKTQKISTPESRMKQVKLDELTKQALDQIELLSSPDYILSEDAQETLDDWESGRKEEIEQSFKEKESKEEDYLAKRGLADSSAANTLRRQNDQDKFNAMNNLSKEKTQLKQNVKNADLANQYNIYSLAQDQRNYDQAMLQENTSDSLSKLNALNQTNSASLTNYYNQQYQNATRYDDLTKFGLTGLMSLL